MSKYHVRAGLQFMSDRMREASSMAGFGVAAMSIGHVTSPDPAIQVCSTIGALLGTVAVFIPEDSGGSP